MRNVTPLTGDWRLRLAAARPRPGEEIPAVPEDGIAAQVPGCVHTDLLAAGLIPDPFLDRNERMVQWVGRAEWEYQTRLPARPDNAQPARAERTDLVFEGLDTVAEIWLAGHHLGSTRNMHRSYRFDVTGLASGHAPLSVRFASAYSEAETVRAALGPRPGPYAEPFNYVRKMACNFGWDWGPTLVTAGIWRPARIEEWSVARLAEVRPEVTVADGTGQVVARVMVERTASGAARPLRATVRVTRVGGEPSLAAGGVGDGALHEVTLAPGQVNAAVAVTVPDVELWWPRGYGQQPLYACEVTLADAADGSVLDTWTRDIGFRTIGLDTSADQAGSAFTLVVNGVPVFARGVNWIPDDAFPSRVSPARYRERLRQAAAAGVDLIRVWGGGIYEDHAFYAACDELGLMVWQDFLFACAAYPEGQPLRAEVEAEATENVARLMPHPSLVLWNGNNENLWGYADWGWQDELDGADWGEGYYLDVLPKITAAVDPTRPYWAGTPWSGTWDRHPNDPDHGTVHSWEVWNRSDYTGYLSDVPRFVAEFGWQAPPAYRTLRQALGDDPLEPDSPGMLHHQKAEAGNEKLDRGLAWHFGASRDFGEWHYLTQVNQARAIATGVEHWRSHWPRCAGTILWQLNDCWPVTSWAAIDSAGRPRPLYHELRRLYADRLLTFQLRDGQLFLFAINQEASPWNCTATVRRVGSSGNAAAEASIRLHAPARGLASAQVPAEVARAIDPAAEFWVADAGELRACHFGCTDAEFSYPPAEIDISITPRNGGQDADLTVTARSLVRDLLLQPDRLHPDARADQGLVTLLPGESVTYHITGWDPADTQRLNEAIRCVNAPGGIPTSGARRA